MLATTCSNPDVMKTMTHAKIMAILAPSLCSRAADQIARHTSTLQRTPRKNSWDVVSAPLCSIIVAIIRPPEVFGPSAPDSCTIAANTIAPARLPTMQNRRVAAARPHEIERPSAPCVRIIIAEVASSPPAITTIVSATPNTRPWTSGVHPEPASASGPPAVAMMTTPMPM